MDEALAQELSELKAEAVALKQKIKAQPDRDALQIALAAKENRIAALENRITELQKSRGKFLFLRGEFYFLEFVYFLWP